MLQLQFTMWWPTWRTEVYMVTDMEVDNVADMEVHMVVNIDINMEIQFGERVGNGVG